jgi:transcription antitermination protein NusB
MKNSAKHLAREFAVQGLYQWLLGAAKPAQILKDLKDLEGYKEADAKFLKEAINGAIGGAEEFQALLEPLADRKWADVSPVERAVLLLGAYELMRCPGVPYRVAINEGIELAKVFGGVDGHKYVNGILDKLAIQVRPDEVAAKRRTNA